MRNLFKDPRVVIAIAILCGLVAVILFYQKYNDIMMTKKVLVAKQDIKLDNLLSSKNAVFDGKPSGGLPNDYIVNEDEVQDKVAKGFIPAGTTIRKSMLKDNKGIGIEAKLGENPQLIATSFEADLYTTIGGQLKIGSIVTVKALLKSMEGTTNTTVLIGERIPVWHVDSESNQKAVVLGLTQEQFDNVTRVNANGAKYQFGLRGDKK